MPLTANIRAELAKKLTQYEGKFNHLYLDTKGKVTVGVGHLVANRNDMSTITMYKTKNNLPSQLATLPDKQAEYDKIVKLPWGQRYGATSFKTHTALIMKDADINLLLNKHIDSFYNELTRIYNKTNGYTEDFDKLPRNVQLVLFDMIFNLGASKIVNSFPNFNTSLKAGDWKKAATECNRPDVSPARNQYVKQLLLSIPSPAVKKGP